MAESRVEWSPTLDVKLSKLKPGGIDFRPLAPDLELTLHEDNYRGVMAGLDGYGNPVAVLAPSTLKRRKGTGPPLAPFGPGSRVIKDFVTTNYDDGSKLVVVGAWDGVVSKAGVPFLPYHFDGLGNNPVRDEAHLRPWGGQRIHEQVRGFVHDQFK